MEKYLNSHHTCAILFFRISFAIVRHSFLPIPFFRLVHTLIKLPASKQYSNRKYFRQSLSVFNNGVVLIKIYFQMIL